MAIQVNPLNLFWMNMKRISSKRAFTIIELIFVIIVIGILASVALPKFSESYKQSLISKAQSKVSAIRSAIQVYKTKHVLLGEDPYPDSLSSDNTHLFDTILPSAEIAGTDAGKWEKINDEKYKYHLNDGYIVFEYDKSQGSFRCNPGESSSQELCNYF